VLYCEQVCFASKNLFNTAQYTNRQSYIYGHGIVTQAAMDKMFRSDLNYQLLPAKVSQLVLMQVGDAWNPILNLSKHIHSIHLNLLANQKHHHTLNRQVEI
jgi:hypothetical protein